MLLFPWLQNTENREGTGPQQQPVTLQEGGVSDREDRHKNYRVYTAAKKKNTKGHIQ